jgi:hypothetical protein
MIIAPENQISGKLSELGKVIDYISRAPFFAPPRQCRSFRGVSKSRRWKSIPPLSEIIETFSMPVIVPEKHYRTPGNSSRGSRQFLFGAYSAQDADFSGYQNW